MAGNTPAGRDSLDFIALAIIQAKSVGIRWDHRRCSLAAAPRCAGARLSSPDAASQIAARSCTDAGNTFAITGGDER